MLHYKRNTIHDDTFYICFVDNIHYPMIKLKIQRSVIYYPAATALSSLDSTSCDNIVLLGFNMSSIASSIYLLNL